MAMRRVDGKKTVTIVGMVSIAEWDADDEPTALSIETESGAVSLVEQGPVAEELFDCIGEDVRATGHTAGRGDERSIRIKRYTIVVPTEDDEEELDSDEDQPAAFDEDEDDDDDADDGYGEDDFA